MKSCCTASRENNENNKQDTVNVNKKSSFSKKDMVYIKGGKFLMGTND